MQEAVSGTEAIRTWDEHMIHPDELCARLGTDKANGLNPAQAAAKHEEWGDNALQKKESTPWYIVFLHELTGFFSLLLWAGGFLCFIGFGIQEDKEDKSNLYLGVVLCTVVFLTGIFSYMQTSKSAEMMAQFENFIPPVAFVIRNGKPEQIDAKMIFQVTSSKSRLVRISHAI
jgi:sodium/potassium-transporting ATPase subunit alpha